MKKVCKGSGQSFEVRQGDLDLLARLAPTIGSARIELPPPEYSPAERQRRRMAFRNERRFYHRKSDLSGRQVVSVYSPDKPYRIYSQDEWWGDGWDAIEFGADFDFGQPFFPQFEQLLSRVPRVAMLNRNSENCEYTNISADNRDCYILIESSNNRSCHYSYWMQKCVDCVDCSFCHQCELCYEISDCMNCYNLRYSQNCRQCYDSMFLRDCIGCRDCFGCINLRGKSFCYLNQQLTKDEYLDRMQRFDPGRRTDVERQFEVCAAHFRQFPRLYSQITNAEECTGCYIADSRDCHECYHAFDAEGCRHAVHVWRNSRFNMDVDTVGRNAELIYESINTGIDVYHCLFCMTCWTASELIYCDTCHYVTQSLGCVGLRHKSHCILNRAYTKHEYEQLAARVIGHMRETGEWGQFFPAQLSFFGYNESVAQEYFPLSRSRAEALGFRWHATEETSAFDGRPAAPAECISDVPDTITREVLSCAGGKRCFRIIAAELEYYRKLRIPLPRCSPDERHARRIAQRLPRELHQRACAACRCELFSPYSPERPEVIYCTECYQQSAVS